MTREILFEVKISMIFKKLFASFDRVHVGIHFELLNLDLGSTFQYSIGGDELSRFSKELALFWRHAVDRSDG